MPIRPQVPGFERKDPDSGREEPEPGREGPDQGKTHLGRGSSRGLGASLFGGTEMSDPIGGKLPRRTPAANARGKRSPDLPAGAGYAAPCIALGLETVLREIARSRFTSRVRNHWLTGFSQKSYSSTASVIATIAGR